VDVLAVSRLSDEGKGTGALLLRQQLRMWSENKSVDRKSRGGRSAAGDVSPPAEKASEERAGSLETSVRLFRPAHRNRLGHQAIVRRKWTYQQGRKPGRPTDDVELEGWTCRWRKTIQALGYEKLGWRVTQLGFQVSKTTVSIVLERHGIPPAQNGTAGSSWRVFLNHYKDSSWRADFFTVETLTLQTLYVLSFWKHGTRRVASGGLYYPSTGAMGDPASTTDDVGVTGSRAANALSNP